MSVDYRATSVKLPRNNEFIIVCDALFIGQLDTKIEHVNTTYCPPEIDSYLKSNGRDAVAGVSGVMSETGKSGMELRKTAMEICDYRPLNHTRIM